MERPNLFEQGTSELTQDAVLCWLLAWADGRYAAADPALHSTGRQLVCALLATHDLPEPLAPYRVVVRRQEARLDVIARVGDAYLLGIEDKTESGVHGDQLRVYLDYLWKMAVVEGRRAVAVYVKTGEAAENEHVIRAGWRVFGRAQLRSVLDAGDVAVNGVLDEYRTWLRRREEASAAWRSTPVASTWAAAAWQGLYTVLTARMDWAPGREWGYVSNPRGGFHGMWWGWYPTSGVELYLQLQEHDLAVRLKMKARDGRTAAARHWSNRMLAAAPGSGWTLVRPSRLRPGEHMALALSSSWRAVATDGTIDLEETVERLRALDTWLRGLAARAAVND